jgi:hypothetical protein
LPIIDGDRYLHQTNLISGAGPAIAVDQPAQLQKLIPCQQAAMEVLQQLKAKSLFQQLGKVFAATVSLTARGAPIIG